MHRLASPRAQCFGNVLWSRSALNARYLKSPRVWDPEGDAEQCRKRRAPFFSEWRSREFFASTSKRTRPEIT